jgi:hypothetical protein
VVESRNLISYFGKSSKVTLYIYNKKSDIFLYQKVCCFLGQMCVRSLGFHAIQISGQHVTRDVAPVLGKEKRNLIFIKGKSIKIFATNIIFLMREQKNTHNLTRSGGSTLEFHGCHRHPLDRDALHLEQGGGQAHPLRRQIAPVCSNHLCLQVILFLSDNSILRVPLYLPSRV